MTRWRILNATPSTASFTHNLLTFRMIYAYHENFVLPLSHDEVVHLKGSLIRKMPGDEWQRFANLRLLYGYMYAQSGKKMLFMGDEFWPDARMGSRREAWIGICCRNLWHEGLRHWVENIN